MDHVGEEEEEEEEGPCGRIKRRKRNDIEEEKSFHFPGRLGPSTSVQQLDDRHKSTAEIFSLGGRQRTRVLSVADLIPARAADCFVNIR